VFLPLTTFEILDLEEGFISRYTMLDILATFLLVFILWTIPSAGQRDDDTRLEARQIETRQVDAPAPNVFIERLSQSSKLTERCFLHLRESIIYLVMREIN
jgi:hypothetical protein